MNLLEITAQDLLGKSHEELVLLLIHVRRQSAALGEAADVARAELERNPGAAETRSVTSIKQLVPLVMPTCPQNSCTPRGLCYGISKSLRVAL